MRPRIFITQPVAASAIERLRAVAEVELNPDSLHIATKSELLEKVPRLDILFCLLHDRVDRDVIAAGTRLRAIASMKITPSDIDVAAATERRIPVTVIAPIVTEATADIHFALLLAVARRVVEGDRLARSGQWRGWDLLLLVGADVHGKTLGILGLGRIGRRVAERARGFAMRVLYHDAVRAAAEVERELGLEWVETKEELLQQADFVTLHVPLLPETRHLISRAELSWMKPTAYLINASRGPVVDEAALAEALERKQIAGAALDVFENEPTIHPKLVQQPTVLLAPHIASASVETRTRMAVMAAENVVAVLSGRRPANLVNAEVWKVEA